jgi:hypothetical protein
MTMERAMPNTRAELTALMIVALAACAFLASTAGASAPVAPHRAGPVALRSPGALAAAPLVIAQNPSNPFTLSQIPEPPVSPINPGTLPGSTAAIGGAATGTNSITGLPCNGSGSLSISGAGGLPGTTSAPPLGINETLDQIPVGAPPVTSIYGSQSSLGAC